MFARVWMQLNKLASVPGLQIRVSSTGVSPGISARGSMNARGAQRTYFVLR
jgi:hypothetical protein